MTDTCSCPPGDCHGGHTIDVGPAWVVVPDDRLLALRDDPFATRPRTALVSETRAMAAELLALRARVAELEAWQSRALAVGRTVWQSRAHWIVTAGGDRP